MTAYPNYCAVVTPGFDAYVEQMSPENTALEDIVILLSLDAIPPNLKPSDAFNAFAGDPMCDPRCSAVLMAAAWAAHCFVPPWAAAFPLPLTVISRPPWVDVPSADARSDRGGICVVVPGKIWVEARDGATVYAFRQEDQPVGDSDAMEEEEAMLSVSGAVVFIRRIEVDALSASKIKHLRVQPVKHGPCWGQRWAATGAQETMVPDEPEGGVALWGPPISAWTLTEFYERGGNASEYLATGPRSTTLSTGGETFYELVLRGKVIDAALMFDQLNVLALKCDGMMMRRLALHKETLHLFASYSDYNIAEFFLNRGHTCHGIFPALTLNVGCVRKVETAPADAEGVSISTHAGQQTEENLSKDAALDLYVNVAA